MSRFIFVLVAVLAVFSTRSCGQQKCGADEEYTQCLAHCQPTCEKPNLVDCNRMCLGGCKCKPGLLRSPLGNCVHQQDCPVIWNP